MMNERKNCVCENLTNIKTKLVILGSDTKSLSEDLKNALFKYDIYDKVKIKSSSIDNIKNNDVYILKIENIPHEKIIKTIKKIYQSNNSAILFLVGENNLKKINEEVNSFLDSTKLGEDFQGFIDPLNKNFADVIECLSLIEKTKNKISYLWKKLEQSQ